MSTSSHPEVPTRYDSSVDDRITPEMKERGDEYIAQAMHDVREQLHRVFNVAIESCTTLDELFKLQDLSIALNGLLLSAKKGPNG